MPCPDIYETVVKEEAKDGSSQRGIISERLLHDGTNQRLQAGAATRIEFMRQPLPTDGGSSKQKEKENEGRLGEERHGVRWFFNFEGTDGCGRSL